VENEFGLRATASEAFPPDITSSHIRAAVSRYEDEISAASEKSVCCCCGRLIDAGDIYEVHEDAHFILALQDTVGCTVVRVSVSIHSCHCSPSSIPASA
jgi:hypothetical protein